MPKNIARMTANRTERNNRWILHRRKFGHQRRIQGCAVLLAVIEGVGIGFQKMFAGSTKLEMPQPPPSDGAMV
ncbi:hypothetical protein COL922a_008785 [Colletotrichum nupharicola]|nr:hypothetical protein COL922a_008785 [Colletotrichum nupharicola]